MFSSSYFFLILFLLFCFSSFVLVNRIYLFIVLPTNTDNIDSQKMKVELITLLLLLLSILQTVDGILWKIPAYTRVRPMFTLTPSNHIIDMTYKTEELMKSSAKKKSPADSLIPRYLITSISSVCYDCKSYLSLLYYSSLSCVRSGLLLRKLQVVSSFSKDPVTAGLYAELEKVHKAKFKRLQSDSPLYYVSSGFLKESMTSLQTSTSKLKGEFNGFSSLFEKLKEESFGAVKDIKKCVKVIKQSKTLDQFLAYSYYEWLDFPHKKKVLIPSVLFIGARAFAVLQTILE
jgi:hypothetical protein